LSLTFLHTDFTDNTEKSGFFKDFSVKRRVNRVVRVLKSF